MLARPRVSTATPMPFARSVLSSAFCRRISARPAIPCRPTDTPPFSSPCARKDSPRRKSTRCQKRIRPGCSAFSEMFTLEAVVPWGRSFDEYFAMFDLSEQHLTLKILDCGVGPASFNAEGTRRGGAITSCDPIYAFTPSQLEDRIAATSREILDQTRRNMAEFVWTSIQSVEKLGELRMSAMRTFLADYSSGRRDGRYVSGELPTLPFADGSFDLALSSHLLFLYTEQFDSSFHCAAIDEMCRVAGEVRIFPL